MEWIILTVAILFTLAGVLCLVAVVFGLPGTWMFIALALIIEFVDRYYRPEGDMQTFSWWILIVAVLLAGLGELLEFFAGMFGAKRAGSTTRGMVGSLIGGIAGGLAGIAVPPPVLGSLFGALVGTFAGAIIGEMSHHEGTFNKSIRPATGATIGRILGTLSKLPIAITVWIGLSVAAFY